MNSGIYKIVNTVNNKFYIGSSINIKKRITTHFRLLKNNIHHSKHLQNSYNKHGLKSFKVIILEIVPIKSLRKREQFYLNKLNPEFNISKSSSSPMLGRKHSKTTLNKFKKRKFKKGKEHHLFGVRWSKS